jgi:hypothetical protein
MAVEISEHYYAVKAGGEGVGRDIPGQNIQLVGIFQLPIFYP